MSKTLESENCHGLTSVSCDFDLENVYDEKISPLMKQIISVCKEHKMPMVASFCFRNNENGNDVANTCLPFDKRQPERLKYATKAVCGEYDVKPLSFTISTNSQLNS